MPGANWPRSVQRPILHIRGNRSTCNRRRISRGDRPRAARCHLTPLRPPPCRCCCFVCRRGEQLNASSLSGSAVSRAAERYGLQGRQCSPRLVGNREMQGRGGGGRTAAGLPTMQQEHLPMPDAAAATEAGSPEAFKDPNEGFEVAEMPPLSALISSAEGGKGSAEALKAQLLGMDPSTGKVPGGAAAAAGPLEMQQVMAVQVRCGDSAVRVGDLLGLLLGAGTPPEAAAAALGGAFAQPLQAAATPGRSSSHITEALNQAVLLAVSQKAKENHHHHPQQHHHQHLRGQQQQQQQPQQQEQVVYVDMRAPGRLHASSPRPSPEPFLPHGSTPGSAVSSGLRRRSVAAPALNPPPPSPPLPPSSLDHQH